MDLGLKDKVYVATGATRGLGFAAARELAADGARVLVSGRGKESVAAAVAELDAIGGAGTAHGLAADNADPATAERLIAEATGRFGRLDGVLISVGGPQAARWPPPPRRPGATRSSRSSSARCGSPAPPPQPSARAA